MNSYDEDREDLVLLDACVLINLLATGRAEEILNSLPYRFALARYVAEEEVFSDNAQDRTTPHPLITSLIGSGTLTQLDIATDAEQRALVHFAIHLDDGEAHTCALATVRSVRVATDDRKAIRVLREVWPEEGDPCIRTAEILFDWAELEQIEASDLAIILDAVTHGASFFPPRDDPHHRRWMQLVREIRSLREGSRQGKERRGRFVE